MARNKHNARLANSGKLRRSGGIPSGRTNPGLPTTSAPQERGHSRVITAARRVPAAKSAEAECFFQRRRPSGIAPDPSDLKQTMRSRGMTAVPAPEMEASIDQNRE